MVAATGLDSHMAPVHVGENVLEVDADIQPKEEKKIKAVWQSCHSVSKKPSTTLLGTICSLPEHLLDLINKITTAFAAIFHLKKQGSIPAEVPGDALGEYEPQIEPDILLTSFFAGQGMGDGAQAIRHYLNFADLTLIKRLDVSEENLATVPPELAQLTFLEDLYFSGNQFQALPLELLGARNHLKELDVSWNDLKQVHDWIGCLNNLVNLNLAHNQLLSLPLSLGLLLELKGLNIANNKLTQLPDTIDSLFKLEEIEVDGNNLVLLPSALCECKSLQRLFCAGNKIKELPSAIGNLHQLTQVNFSQNLIAQLPSSITKCPQLKYLNVSHNRLAHLPNGIGKLQQLTTLSIANNSLTSLPDDFVKLKLDTLDLSFNPFKEFPAVLFELGRLHRLILDTDQFQKWQLPLGELKKRNPKIEFCTPDIPPQQFVLA
jgi:hypothetical protein